MSITAVVCVCVWQARIIFCVVWAAWEKYSLHEGNTKFNTHNEE